MLNTSHRMLRALAIATRDLGDVFIYEDGDAGFRVPEWAEGELRLTDANLVAQPNHTPQDRSTVVALVVYPNGDVARVTDAATSATSEIPADFQGDLRQVERLTYFDLRRSEAAADAETAALQEVM